MSEKKNEKAESKSKERKQTPKKTVQKSKERKQIPKKTEQKQKEKKVNQTQEKLKQNIEKAKEKIEENKKEKCVKKVEEQKKTCKKVNKMLNCNLKNFLKSVKLNYIFFIGLAIATILFSTLDNNSGPMVWRIYMGFISLILAILFSYHIHRASHFFDYMELYDNYINNLNLSKPYNYLMYPIKKLIYLLALYADFHDKYHHDSDINREYLMLFYEGSQNILNCGGFLVILFYLTNFKVHFFKNTYTFNYNIIILWSLFYASYHLINYNLKGPDHVHSEHHINCYTNYGFDFMDCLYGTKYDINHMDNMNDGIINIILITIFLLLIRQFKQYIF